MKVTPENHGPLVNVAMWMAMAPMIVVTGVKVWTKRESVGKFQRDDLFMLFSMLLAIAQSVATTEEVRNGLGRNRSSLTEHQINSFYLYQLVAELLYLVSIFITKMVALQFYSLIADPHSQKPRIKACMYLFLLWIAIAVFVTSFQCHPPQTWLPRSGGCINMPAFWVLNTIVDILTQFLISLLPVYLLQDLHTKTFTKIFSMLAFTPNLLTIPLSIIRLVYVFTSYSSNNYTWDSATLAMITALHAILGVLIAGIPFSKPIIDGIALVPFAIAENSQGGYTLGSIYGSAARGATSLHSKLWGHRRNRSGLMMHSSKPSWWSSSRSGGAFMGNLDDPIVSVQDEGQELREFGVRTEIRA